MRFYHYVERSLADSILKEGLLPTRSEKRCVFLWDSYDLAVDSCRILFRSEPLKIAILEIDIPQSWAELDTNYSEGEAEYGHSFQVRKRIPAKMIKLKDTCTLGVC
jgi:hypothetical protein